MSATNSSKLSIRDLLNPETGLLFPLPQDSAGSLPFPQPPPTKMIQYQRIYTLFLTLPTYRITVDAHQKIVIYLTYFMKGSLNANEWEYIAEVTGSNPVSPTILEQASINFR